MGDPAVKTEPSRRMTLAEYFEFEAAAEFKHEYVNGQVLDMSGASYEHTLIAPNVVATVHQQLRGTACRVHSSDLRVRVGTKYRYRYPDATIVCGAPAFDEQDPRRLTLANPKVVLEVLSPSTEATDRGDKLRDYMSIPSVVAYVLINQHRPIVEVVRRSGDNLVTTEFFTGLDATLRLEDPPLHIPLRDIYAGVELTDEEE